MRKKKTKKKKKKKKDHIKVADSFASQWILCKTNDLICAIHTMCCGDGRQWTLPAIACVVKCAQVLAREEPGAATLSGEGR